MPALLRNARRFLRAETGATMAEYALLLAVIALVAIVGAKALGTSVNTQLNSAATKVSAPLTP